jgi:tetratricopeptide (TPR) repeat protein
MERPKYTFIIIILVFAAFSPVWATSYKSRIYDAYISNNMPMWKTIIDEMEDSKNKDKTFLMELVNFQYGYIAYCIGLGKMDEAEKYLSLAKENLEKAEKSDFEESEISAYKSAFYGFEIGINKMKAPFIGPKSVKYSKLAMEQNPQNPMGYIQYGNSQFYMSPVFGGSKTEAVKHLKKAEKLMEKDKERLENDWNYLSVLALIGQSFVAMEDYKNAKIYFEKALKVEPNFLLIKIDLLPKLMSKMK